MHARVLLSTKDSSLQRVMQNAVCESGAETEISSEAGEARWALMHKRFDLLVLDCDDKSGIDILMAARQGCLNRHCIVLAITSGLSTVKSTYELGANFVLDKPVSMEQASRTMQGALECILRERRKYFRHPIASSAQLRFSDLLDLRVQLCNVSEGGAAIQSTIPLYPGWGVDMKLNLTGDPESIEAGGYVAWAHRNGHAGIRFMVLSEKARKQLNQWLDSLVIDVDLAEDFDRVFPPTIGPVEISSKI